MNRHVGERLAHHHDQARVGHDQCVRAHLYDRLEVSNIVLQLIVVRRDVARQEELFAGRVRFLDALCEHIFLAELVVAHPQAVTRLPGIDRRQGQEWRGDQQPDD